MPTDVWPAHDAYHQRHGDFGVQADPFWFAAPREWAAPHSWEEAQALGMTEYLWADLQVSRELVNALRGSA